MSRLGYVMHLYLGEFVVQKNFSKFSFGYSANKQIYIEVDGWMKRENPYKGI